ncbi:MAG: SPOR domain-containing protein [Candidatus Omnitrophota bacterium]
MEYENFKIDFFEKELGEKKARKPGFLQKYSEHRFLPYVKIQIEYIVMICIGILVLAIVAYAIGVESGKRISRVEFARSLGDVHAGTVTGQIRSSDAKDVTSEFTMSSGSRYFSTPGSWDTDEILPGFGEADEGGPGGGVPAVTSAQDASTAESGRDRDKETGFVGSVYIIQLASFKNESSARQEEAKLKGKGVDVRLAKKGDWYQVYAAGYNTIGEATKAKDGFIWDYVDCFIKRVK